MAMPFIPKSNTYTSNRLIRMLSRLIDIEIHMVAREFCIPKNQPLNAYVPSTAGAPHIQIWKYVNAMDSVSPPASMKYRTAEDIGD